MNNKVRSLINMYKYIHYRNTVSVILYILMILIGSALGLVSLMMYKKNFAAVSVFYIFAIENILFMQDYNMYLSGKNKEIQYIKIMPISKRDYIYSKFIYGALIILKVTAVTFITLNLIIRDYANNNIFIIASAINILAIAYYISKDVNGKRIDKKNKVNKYTGEVILILFLLTGFVLPKLFYKFKESAITKITSLNYINLSGGIYLKGIIIFLISIAIYFIVMQQVMRKDSE